MKIKIIRALILFIYLLLFLMPGDNISSLIICFLLFFLNLIVLFFTWIWLKILAAPEQRNSLRGQIRTYQFALVVGFIFLFVFLFINPLKDLLLLESVKEDIRQIQAICNMKSSCPNTLEGWVPSEFAELEKSGIKFQRRFSMLYMRTANKREFSVKWGLDMDQSYEFYGGVDRDLKFYL